MLLSRLSDRGVVLLDKGQSARIAGYSLAFNKRSLDGSCKANLMPAQGEASWGILVSVDSSSLIGLDAAEGAPGHYRRETVTVHTEQGERKAMTYQAQAETVMVVPNRPWDWYLALVLAGGKACSGIPSEWIKHLQKVGSPKKSSSHTKAASQAVAQLKAAGFDRWQDLLLNSTKPIL